MDTRSLLAKITKCLSWPLFSICLLMAFSFSPCQAQKVKKVPPKTIAKNKQDSVIHYSVTFKKEDIIDDLYLDDNTGNASKHLEQLLKLYPEEDFELGDDGRLISMKYNNCDPILLKSGSLNHTFEISFWHDKEKKKPCLFYVYTDRFNRNGNNVIAYQPTGDDNVVKEELQHMQRTNKITRKRNNTRPFHFFVPSHIYAFDDYDYEKAERHENDTIYMRVRLYNAKDSIILRGDSGYIDWVRYPPEESKECYHQREDTTDVEIGRFKIDEGLYLIKFDRIRKCQKCGRQIVENNIERTVTIDEKKEKSEHEHVWQYLDDDIDFNSFKKEMSSDKCYIRESYTFKVRRQCLICGERQMKEMEDATILPNSDAAFDRDCCPRAIYMEEVEEKPAVIVGDRMRMDKVIKTFYYCPDNEKKQLIGLRTETEWSEPCRHDFKLISTEDLGLGEISRDYHNAEYIDHYQCKICGMLMDKRRTKQCDHQYKQKKLCSIGKPWKRNINGVPLKMKLVRFEEDSSAVYVAETETTQQLWTTICPDNKHGWDNKSTYPVTGVTAEEIKAFISRLNTLASQQGFPLRFRLPEAEEWTSTYLQGNDEQGWISNYGSCIHPVAELPANKVGLFDMKGNVAELCSDTCYSNDGYKTLNHAVAGLSFNETSISRHPSTYQWIDMSEGKEFVGFRLFADPVDGDETMWQDTEEMEIGKSSKQIGNYWLIRHAYQCMECGHLKYGSRHHTKAYKDKKPIGCE